MSQEGFDNSVADYIEDLEMTREEAIEMAIEEFQERGLSLDNINTSLDEDKTTMKLMPRLNKLLEEESPNKDELISVLEEIEEEIKDSKKTKIYVANKGLLELLAFTCEKTMGAVEMLVAALDCFAVTLIDCQENRDKFPRGLFNLFPTLLEDNQNNPSVLKVIYRIVKLGSIECEQNKRIFVGMGMVLFLKDSLKEHMEHRELVKEGLGAIRSVTLDDDFRSDTSKYFDTARAFVDHGMLNILYDLFRTYDNDLEVIPQLCFVLRRLAVKDVICDKIRREGGLQLVLECLHKHMDVPVVARQTAAAIRVFAQHDLTKNKLFSMEVAGTTGAQLICAAMGSHPSEVGVQDSCCAAVAALCLRSAENSAQMFKFHAHELVLNAMASHKDRKTVQKQGAMAIRNMVSRNKDFIKPILEWYHPATKQTCESLIRTSR
eukprot:TRINITY_DN9412_c0_g3_i3.p1 TRINITY_DN9412_c0_g3~~TRINITY_DN9412_c0_g3_i3.p1  ORF type:complete len:434 (-),score=137.03 TRINITY_DN9412_c0_g3_i3:420-1721(-)